MLYEIVFTDADGMVQRSRIFQKLTAARRWAKWLRQQSFVKSVRIMAGGAGGMEVA